MEGKRRLIFTIVISLMLLTFGISQGAVRRSSCADLSQYHGRIRRTGRNRNLSGKIKQQMAYLYENGYAAISADDLVRYMKGGVVPKKLLSLLSMTVGKT